MDTMMIGAFAKATGISKRMLRHYDQMNILKPVYTNPENEYRYYSRNQIGLLDVVKSLQDFGFSLNEIKDMMYGEMDKFTFLESLKDKEALIRTSIDNQVSQLLGIQKSIATLTTGLSDNHKIPLDVLSEKGRSQWMTKQNNNIKVTHNIDSIKAKLHELPNQSFFSEQIEEFLESNNQRPVYYATFDIDNFAPINDQYGFDIGDAVIYQCYDIIDHNFNELILSGRAIISRLGGDEFALFIHSSEESVILSAVENTLEDVRSFDFSVHQCDRKITETCGICKMTRTTSPVELRHISTKAMIEAKRNGRDRYSML